MEKEINGFPSLVANVDFLPAILQLYVLTQPDRSSRRRQVHPFTLSSTLSFPWLIERLDVLIFATDLKSSIYGPG
jgi:hypothetical protein